MPLFYLQPGGIFGASATSQPGTSLFGNTQTQSAGFGQPTSTGFGGFGQTQQQAGLFGGTKPAFGTATTSAGGMGFGQQNTSLFSKPATSTTGFSFGQNQAPGFGQYRSLLKTKYLGFYIELLLIVVLPFRHSERRY